MLHPILTLLAIFAAARVEAQTAGVQSLTSPRLLVVAGAMAGQRPAEVSDGTARLTVTATTAGVRLNVRLLSALPGGLVMELRATSASGVTGGTVTLSTSPTELLRVLGQGTTVTIALSYTIRASASMGPTPFTSVQVAFDLVPEP